jgi:hypothetical protein
MPRLTKSLVYRSLILSKASLILTAANRGDRVVVNILCYILFINALVRFIPTVLLYKLIPFKILIIEVAKSEVISLSIAARELIAAVELIVAANLI